MRRAVITRNGNIGGNSYLCTFYVCRAEAQSWPSAGGGRRELVRGISGRRYEKALPQH
jgi:hypothetical protein